MKKNLIFSLAFAAFAFMATQSAQAQSAASFSAPAVNAESQTLADEVIAQQLTDPDAANKSFSKLLKKIKNDKEQLVAVGKFFLDKNIYPCANQCAKQAYTIAPTDISVLMLNAHVSMMRKDWGSAGQKFDEILAQDPNNIDALRLNARVYKYVNPIVAKETLAKIIAIEPNNPLPYKELGDIAYDGREDKEAIDAYKKYFEMTPQLSEKDIAPAENYLITLLRSTDDYITVRDMSAKLLEFAPQNITLRRVHFIAQVELADEAKTTEAMKYITEKHFADSAYTYSDYSYASRFANEIQGNRPLAIEFINKALAIDSTKADGYKSLATLLQRDKKAAAAIPAYEKYLALQGNKVSDNDRLGLARIYIDAQKQAATPEEKQRFIDTGDKLFEELAAANPESYQIPYFRAQLWIKNSKEPEEKPREYFEKALKLIGDNAELNSRKVVAMSYLMIYTLKKDQDEACRNYVTAILKLDPQNQAALDIQKILN